MGSVASTLNNRYRLDKKIGEGGFAQVFADPERASRGYSRNKGRQDFSETVLVDKPLSSPSR